MAVDLTDELIEAVKRECSPPGTDLFPTATDDDWLGQLRDSFWEAKLYGFFHGFTESDGLIAPISGTTDLGRDQQALIVLFAGGRVIRNELKNTNTSFRAQAGSVEFEVQNSANLLIAVLKDIRSKVDLALIALGVLNKTTVTYVDALIGRSESIYFGDTSVAGGGSGGYGPSPYDGRW